MTLKELREKRKAIADRMKALHDKATSEARALTTDEQKTWDADDAEYKALSARIDTAVRAEQIETEQRASAGGSAGGRSTPGTEDRDTRVEQENEDDEPETRAQARWARADEKQRRAAIGGWIRAQAGKVPTAREVEAGKALGVRFDRPEIDIPLLTTAEVRRLQQTAPEKRLQQTGVGPSGGYTVAPVFMARAEVALLNFGGLRNHAEIIRTNTGAEITWPTADDTSNMGEQIGEGTDGSEQDIAFEQQVWNAYGFSSKTLKVSNWLLEDSEIDVEALVEEMLGERIGRRVALGYAQGSGAATIRGITVAAPVGKTAASATAIVADELFDLVHSVDPAYRVGAQWLMHDNILLAIRKLKDGEGNYLWQPGLTAGDPGTLLGYKIVIDNSMPSALTSGAFPIVFGLLSKYKIRDVRTMRLVRMSERYADENAVGFVAFLRTDGDLLDAGTGPVKKLAMP